MASHSVWLEYAKQLQALASTGLFFGESEFDKERYAQIEQIAHRMMADLAAVPLSEIPALFPTAGQSYATPLIDVRGAVLRGEEILLVQEKSDQRWTLPGGYADVGLSAAQNVCKEIQEEAGLLVTATKLYAVKHKAKHEYDPDLRDFYKFCFLCTLDQVREPSPGLETMGARFVHRDALPELSTGRVIVADIEAAFAHAADPSIPTLFD